MNTTYWEIQTLATRAVVCVCVCTWPPGENGLISVTTAVSQWLDDNKVLSDILDYESQLPLTMDDWWHCLLPLALMSNKGITQKQFRTRDKCILLIFKIKLMFLLLPQNWGELRIGTFCKKAINKANCSGLSLLFQVYFRTWFRNNKPNLFLWWTPTFSSVLTVKENTTVLQRAYVRHDLT